MKLNLVLQVLLNGLTLSMIYILVGVGFTLVLGVARVLNFAHTQFYMLGTYAFWLIYESLGHHCLLGMIGGTLSMVILGGVVYCLLFRRLIGNFFMSMVASIGLGLITVQSVILIFGERDLLITPIFPGVTRIAGAVIPAQKVAILLTALILAVGVYLLLKTKMGKAMYAVSINREVAAALGINTDRIYLFVLLVGSGMAGIAGTVMAPMTMAASYLGNEMIIFSLLVVVLGGGGQVKGAVIAGFILGLAESFGYQLFGNTALIYIFLLVGVIMYLRPGGLFGVPHELG